MHNAGRSLVHTTIMKTITHSYLEEIDFQRAILISFVILVHIVNFGIVNPDIKSGILSFLMPTFLLVTGYLMNMNKPVGKFALYLLRILLPYVILVTGYMLLSLYLPVRDGIQQLDWSTAVNVLCIRSIGPYWFFRVMLICAFLGYVTFRCLHRHSNIIKLTAYGTVLLCISHFTPLLDWASAFYFFIGIVLRVSAVDYNRLFVPSGLTVIPLLLILFVDSEWEWSNLSVIIMTFCFLSFAAYIKRFFHGRTLDAILYIGRNTLPIYMFHPIFTMAAKYLQPLFRFDGSGFLHAFMVIVLGIAGSLLIAKVMDKLRLSWIFGKAQLLR